LITEKSDDLLRSRLEEGRLWSWLAGAVTLLLLGAGLWYLLSKVSLVDLASALKLARLEFIALSVVVMILTLLAKCWRWRTLLSPREPLPPIRPLFWSIMLGQYVNLLVPFLRLGELARVYALSRQLDIRKTRALSTLVVEKTLDLLMLGLMLAVLLSTVVLPDFVSSPNLAIGLIALAALLVFYLLAYQSELLVHLLKKTAAFLPEVLGRRVVSLGLSGLEGLAALRDRRALALLLAQSTLIAVLSLMTPWTLFPALNIPLGISDAMLIHVVVTLALVPPTTPGKLVVFDGTVAFLLRQLGVEAGAVIAAYTIVYHLVILLPQIALGSAAASRTDWHWRKVMDSETASRAGASR